MSVLLRGSKRLLLMDLPVSTTTGSVSAVSNVFGGKVKANKAVGYVSGQRFISFSRVRSMSVPAAMPSTIAGETGGRISQPPPPTSSGDTIRITDKCRERLRQILDEKGTFLRVSVEGGGCSGFQYKFEVDKQQGPDDVVIAKDRGGNNAGEEPVLVVIDEISLDLIRGSTLDYETELIRSTFRILNNPHAEQGCSCGASFNMKL